ncbi:MAG: hypothetical protein HY761_03360 [Candidatus Omnitrophica bacterium]|nr:hypothetical protein [Candidatus Omnitrophota bacterium]
MKKLSTTSLTLIELLITISIIVVVMLGISAIFLNFTKLTLSSVSRDILYKNTNFAIEHVLKNTKGANYITISSANPATLNDFQLRYTNTPPTPTRAYYLDAATKQLRYVPNISSPTTYEVLLRNVTTFTVTGLPIVAGLTRFSGVRIALKAKDPENKTTTESFLQSSAYCRVAAAGIVRRMDSTRTNVLGIYSSIQEAVDAASNGDIIQVSSNDKKPYKENVTVTNKSLILEGAYDHKNNWIRHAGDANYETIVDGGNIGRIFYINGVNNTVVMDSFSLTNGKNKDNVLYGGAAIYSNGVLTVRNCRIFGNTGILSSDDYATILHIEGSLGNNIIDHCVIFNNSVERLPAEPAAGVRAVIFKRYASNLNIVDSVIGDPDLTDGLSQGNKGNLMYVVFSVVTIDLCYFDGNSGTDTMMYYFGTGSQISNSFFRSNTYSLKTTSFHNTSYYGKIIYGKTGLLNCFIYGNKAGNCIVDVSDQPIKNCSFRNNEVLSGAILSSNNNSVSDTICSGNREVDEPSVAINGSCSLDNSLVINNPMWHCIYSTTNPSGNHIDHCIVSDSNGWGFFYVDRNASPGLVISNSISRNNQYGFGMRGDCLMKNNLIYNIRVAGNITWQMDSTGGMIYYKVTFQNCTVAGGVAGGAGGIVGIRATSNHTITIVDSIVAFFPGGYGFGGGPSGITIKYSDFFDNLPTHFMHYNDPPPGSQSSNTILPAWGWDGTGVIDTNPLFVDAANGDYHLLAGPCKTASSTGAEIGAYGGLPAGSIIGADPSLAQNTDGLGKRIGCKLPGLTAGVDYIE